MNEQKTYLYEVLDRCFRDRLGGAMCSHFGSDEYNEQEQHELTDLCHAIADTGYRVLEARIIDSDFQQLLDTAAEYGCLVSGELAPSYLGIFVAAQMLMKPFASAGFCRELMRSEVYARADARHQQLARLLMLIATFVPGKVQSGPESEELREAFEDLAKLDIPSLDAVKALVGEKNEN